MFLVHHYPLPELRLQELVIRPRMRAHVIIAVDPRLDSFVRRTSAERSNTESPTQPEDERTNDET